MKPYAFALCFVSAVAFSSDLNHAFPSFSASGKTVIPVDFKTVSLDLTFDPASSTAIGRCEIDFYAEQAGSPAIDLIPNPRKVILNGSDLGASGLARISSPDGVAKMRVANGTVTAGSNNTLEVEYTIPSSQVTFSSNGARIVWAMNDLGTSNNFLEQYACANFEYDHFPMSLRVEVTGTSAPHQIFTNGSLEMVRTGLWRIEFPDYFTSSSHFFHLTDRKLEMKMETFSGVQKEIPVVVYGAVGSPIDSGMRTAKATLSELESSYGPYTHDSLTVYLTGASGSGMEHAGGTITSLGALEHEITHSWFARGVMPADGNAGWIDESIASWRDEGYPTSRSALTASPTQLSGFSAYRRYTTMAAYSDGMSLMARFDSLFGGLKPVLKEIFTRAKETTVTTAEFQSLLETVSGKNVDAYFKRYVFNNGSRRTLDPLPMLTATLPAHVHCKHPRSFTIEEIRELR